MFRSFGRSVDRFSLQRFRYLVNELQEIKFVNRLNWEFVLEILRSIVEIVTYGDRHDPSIFECFMEYQLLAEFLRILKINKNASIEAPFLHYLSIMIQNLASEHSIYYCFSNEYINKIILHPYKFDGGDLALYYVSFLRSVSGKLNKDTLCLLVKVQEDVVVSFPLYSGAIKFATHEEKMIQIAVRALTLNIYNVADEMVCRYITTPPASEYFLDLVLNLRGHCYHLDAAVNATKYVQQASDSQSFDPSPTCQGTHISAITSLYMVCRLIQIVGGKWLVNSVAVVVLYTYMVLSGRVPTERSPTSGTGPGTSFFGILNELEEMRSGLNSEGTENTDKNHLIGHLSEFISSSFQSVNCTMDEAQQERDAILSLGLSDNYSVLLASLMLFLVLSESKDLHPHISSMIGFTQKNTGMDEQMMASSILLSHSMDIYIFSCQIPQILNVLLKVLASQPAYSASAQWNTGWLVRRLLIFQEKKFTDNDFSLFNISYERSRERLLNELSGCWFDCIPITLKNEWEKCKTVLEESSLSKDPAFAVELSFNSLMPDIAGDVSSSLAWERMIDAVKVFVLHHQLKAFIEGSSLENPLLHLRNNSFGISGRTKSYDFSSSTFGTELGLGPRIPCKIAFSKSRVMDIYLIPVVKDISGILLLVEKPPLPSQLGDVIAVSPLAGLCPKLDENHPTWLHLRIREFDLGMEARKASRHPSNASDHAVDGRWTLGFPDAKSCEAAQSLLLEEIGKQKSSVESVVIPLFQNNSLGA
ncbi:protein TRANSPARENT TESTA 9-like isoform X2 [Macadamia integrifolia]|uniref:protein TRANSPARENT TESTA 9-like isoform X2 n=1 Tax=Macadamia integrifolia TaxID=60698 RepID=UPI001C4ED2FC|nr:protein TRANSPARENT TESTA 9-like isoform X2 [Macadamia integrifolia]